jgi:hypothetical protein
MPSLLNHFRPLRTPLCVLIATGLGVLGSVPMTLFETPAAHALVSQLTIVNVLAGDAQVELSIADDSPLLYTDYEGTCISSDGGASATESVPYGGGALVVHGLTNFKTYTCVLQGKAGGNPLNDPSDPTAPFTPGHVPLKPTVDSVVVNGSGSVAIALTPDAGDDSPIIDYSAGCISDDAGANLAIAEHVSTATVTVSGLTVGAAYKCVGVANNDFGGSENSDFSNPIVAATVPDAPAIVGVTPGDGQISVAFTPAPDDGGSPVVGYTATCAQPGAPETSTSENGSSSPIDVNGLENEAVYACTVHATNLAGASPESDASNEVTVVPGVAPSPAHGVSVIGTLIAERTLTSHGAGWTGTPTPMVTRRWQRCNANLSGCTTIVGATGTNYTMTNADVDKRIKFTEHAANGVGNASRTTITGVIRTVPVSTSGPYYYVSGGSAVKAPAGTVGATTHGNIVWRATATGNVFGPHFGPGDGTLRRIKLKKPIVGIVATASGKGYWMFAADGGIFTFGDAKFYGSTGALRLKAPIISMTVMPNGKGYWLFASDGGVFTFGAAHFYGSTGAQKMAYPVVAMLSTQTGKGYWLVTRDGRAIRFGDAVGIGRARNHTDIVGLVSKGNGYRFITARRELVVPH